MGQGQEPVPLLDYESQLLLAWPLNLNKIGQIFKGVYPYLSHAFE